MRPGIGAVVNGNRGSTGVEPCEEDQDQWYRMLEAPRARDAYIADRERWMEWVDADRVCLRVRRDLFACEESDNGLQGTAHCVGDRGFIFLRNETDETITGEIPINHWLGLDLDGPGHFYIRQFHPQPTAWACTLGMGAGRTWCRQGPRCCWNCIRPLTRPLFRQPICPKELESRRRS